MAEKRHFCLGGFLFVCFGFRFGFGWGGCFWFVLGGFFFLVGVFVVSLVCFVSFSVFLNIFWALLWLKKEVTGCFDVFRSHYFLTMSMGILASHEDDMVVPWEMCTRGQRHKLCFDVVGQDSESTGV